MLVWLNGSFIDRDQASVSVFDAGFQHGVGLFETMLARNGAVFRIEAHLDRLGNSAKELLLTQRLRIDPLADAVELALTRNHLQHARVRLTLTGGNLNLLEQSAKSQVDPTILIVAQPPTVYPKEFFEKGVMAMIADGRENPLHPMAGHKTLNYWPRIRALQIAASKRAGEALWFTVSNHLAGGCVSNIFLVKDDRVLTPIARGEEEQGALPAPVLPGITRAAIIELADEMDLEVSRKMLDINDVLGADEMFLTNSSWGVLPVVGVEHTQIGTGDVGEMTRRLRIAWLDLVEQETRAAQM
jgi:branched-chain amino acid aminotransferase